VPKSRFVESRRLRPLLVYCALALVVLLVADAFVSSLADGVRRFVVPAWMILFPLGGWFVWRRG
jgi:hypothetical protein